LRNYHSVLILKPDLDEDQVDHSVEKITSIINKFGGSILKLDKWGKKRLAYRIKKNKFGYYLNVYHTCEQGRVLDLEKGYQLYEQIIKYLVIRLEERDIVRVMDKDKESAAESAKDSAVEENRSKETVAAGEPDKS